MEEHCSTAAPRTNLRFMTSDISELSRNGWLPIWVSFLYDPGSSSIPEDYLLMQDWCKQYCVGGWTTGWWQEDLAFWFEYREDATMFQMVWR